MPSIRQHDEKAVAILSLYGLYIAGTALRNGRIVAEKRRAGDLEVGASVTMRPEASLWGIPNSVYGLVYYTSLLPLTRNKRLSHPFWHRLVVVATWGAALRSLTLLATLIRTRTWCSICMKAHLVNGLLLLLVRRIQA